MLTRKEYRFLISKVEEILEEMRPIKKKLRKLIWKNKTKAKYEQVINQIKC